MFGPKLNNIPLNKSNRDPLGTESVTTNISADIQRVIISPTDKAVYWPYYNWLYYSFYENRDKKDWTVSEFKKYLKREEKVFVLANLLNGFDQGLNGITEASKVIEKNPNALSYNLDFEMIKSMQNFNYYTSGLRSLNLIKYDETLEESSKYHTGHCTNGDGKGTLLGEVVHKRIKETVYYKKYHNTDINDIPASVLKEFGNAIPFDLKDCAEIKNVFNEILYEGETPRLITEYMEHLYFEYEFDKLTPWLCLHYLYDKKELSKKSDIPLTLIDTSKKCEILCGRIIFRFGLEGIWSYVVSILENNPLTENMWISRSLDFDSFEGCNISETTIDEFLNECSFTYKERDKMVSIINKNSSKSIVYGLKFMLSVYLRFYKEKEYEDYNDLLNEGGEESLSLSYWFSFVDENKNLTLEEFLYKLIHEFMIKQHKKVAFRKFVPRTSDYNDPYNYYFTNGLFSFNQSAGISPINLRPISAYEVGLTLGKIKRRKVL